MTSPQNKQQNLLNMQILIQPIHSVQINRGKLYRTRAYPKKNAKQLQNPQLTLFASPHYHHQKLQYQQFKENWFNNKQTNQSKPFKHYRRNSQSPLRDIKTLRGGGTSPSIPSTSQVFAKLQRQRPKSMIIEMRGRNNYQIKERLNDIFKFSMSSSDYFTKNRFRQAKKRINQSSSSEYRRNRVITPSKRQLVRLIK